MWWTLSENYIGGICSFENSLSLWSRHANPNTQDNNLGDCDHIHFSQYLDPSEKSGSCIKQGDWCEVAIFPSILSKFFQTGKKRLWNKKRTSAAGDNFSNLYMCLFKHFGRMDYFVQC